MNNSKKYIKTAQIVIALVLLFSACDEEIPTGLNLTPERSVFDTTYITPVIPSPQPGNVLIEDFTGVKCVNCPRAHEVAKKIMTSNPNRVFVLAIHPLNYLDQFTKPFVEGDDHISKYDFRTKEGGDIFELLGRSSSMPIGAINRILFSGESTLLIEDSKWNAKTGEQLAKNAIVNIDTFGKKGIYYAEANKIRINVKLTYTQNTNDSQYVSIALIEDGLIDPQKNSPATVDEYEHNHVLRRMVTPSTGKQLKGPIVAGKVFETTYEYVTTPTETWNKKNLKVVVFVHNGTSGSNKFEVRQVKEYTIN